METKTVIFVILLTIGALQGIIYGGILWRTSTIHKKANRFLATILFFFSYRLIAETLHFFGLGKYDTWYYILLEMNWIYGALLYFFVASYVNPNFKISKRHLIHFIPVCIEIIWSFFIKSQNFYWDGTRESLTWLGYWGYVAWMHYPTIYLIGGGLLMFYCYKSWQLLKNPPQIQGYKILPKQLDWIKRVVIVLGIFSLIFTLVTTIDFLFFDYAFNFFGYPIFIVMAIITYWLGLEGFSRRHTLALKEIEILTQKDRTLLEAIAKKITQKMDEGLYKNQDLSVALIAKAIDVKPYLITKTFTTIFEKKFSDYINELRFNELKKLLSKPNSDKFTLLSLAFEAGFNSKASFNRTVTKITGKSPKHLKSDS